jgi:hypothetical protein
MLTYAGTYDGVRKVSVLTSTCEVEEALRSLCQAHQILYLHHPPPEHPTRTVPAYVSIRQHTSACVSIRQHTSAYVSIRQHTSAYVSMRQHASAYVSIRQHTSAYVSIRARLYLAGTKWKCSTSVYARMLTYADVC